MNRTQRSVIAPQIFCVPLAIGTPWTQNWGRLIFKWFTNNARITLRVPPKEVPYVPSSTWSTLDLTDAYHRQCILLAPFLSLSLSHSALQTDLSEPAETWSSLSFSFSFSSFSFFPLHPSARQEERQREDCSWKIFHLWATRITRKGSIVKERERKLKWQWVRYFLFFRSTGNLNSSNTQCESVSPPNTNHCELDHRATVREGKREREEKAQSDHQQPVAQWRMCGGCGGCCCFCRPLPLGISLPNSNWGSELLLLFFALSPLSSHLCKYFSLDQQSNQWTPLLPVSLFLLHWT